MNWATVILVAAVLAAAATVGHTTRTRAEKMHDRIEDAQRGSVHALDLSSAQASRQ